MQIKIIAKSPNLSPYFILLISILNFSQIIKAQNQLDFSGYLSELPSLSWDSFRDKVVFDNVIHNRINLKYDFNTKWNGELSFRNRLFSGNTVTSTPGLPFLLSDDQGIFDFTFNWGSRNDYILNTGIDRFAIEYVKNKLQLKIGRQRVNWGKSMIWNPNDVFNSYSFFDFDYEERPGMDGVRLQYFTGVASSFETVLKVDKNKDITMAAAYKFNFKNYDFQFLGGEMNQEDVFLGGGWSGNIKNAAFYGEMSFLHSLENNKNLFIGSIGSNYTFKNSLTLLFEYLYLSKVDVVLLDRNMLLSSYGSVREISISNNSYIANITYPASPLLNVSIAYMGFDYPVFNNYYIGPQIDYSISDNVSLSAICQYFHFERNGFEMDSFTAFLRLKWNF